VRGGRTFSLLGYLVRHIFVVVLDCMLREQAASGETDCDEVVLDGRKHAAPGSLVVPSDLESVTRDGHIDEGVA